MSLIIVSCGKSTTNGVKNNVHTHKKEFQERIISPFQGLVNEFSEFSQIEIALGTLVIEKGTTARIRELARLMVSQHDKILLRTEKMAYAIGLSLASNASENEKEVVQKLNYYDNTNFDEFYQFQLLERHQAFLKRIQSLGAQHQDTAIIDWIETTIPIIISLIESTELCIKSNAI
jgi:predicted outer membrane protein